MKIQYLPHTADIRMKITGTTLEELFKAGMKGLGTCSYILADSGKNKDITFASCCHGAGRRLSRTAAKEQVNAPVLKEKLIERGIYVEAGSFKGIAEEVPIAYRDVYLVVETISASKVANKLAKLKPVAVDNG